MSNAIICLRWLWPRCSQWWLPLSEVDGLQATACAPPQAAFEDAGVLFIDADEAAGIGLRLAQKRKKRRQPSIK
jgi:hypothetical protein